MAALYKTHIQFARNSLKVLPGVMCPPFSMMLSLTKTQVRSEFVLVLSTCWEGVPYQPLLFNESGIVTSKDRETLRYMEPHNFISVYWEVR